MCREVVDDELAQRISRRGRSAPGVRLEDYVVQLDERLGNMRLAGENVQTGARQTPVDQCID